MFVVVAIDGDQAVIPLSEEEKQAEEENNIVNSDEQVDTTHGTKTKLEENNILVDHELVMKCLSDNVTLNSKCKIALFDFGGQSVFNVIHPFFLTQYGIYITVFNMEWILRSESKFR